MRKQRRTAATEPTYSSSVLLSWAGTGDTDPNRSLKQGRFPETALKRPARFGPAGVRVRDPCPDPGPDHPALPGDR